MGKGKKHQDQGQGGAGTWQHGTGQEQDQGQWQTENGNSKTLEREALVEEDLNILPAASIEWKMITGTCWMLGDSQWWAPKLQPSALGNTVSPADDPGPGKKSGRQSKDALATFWIVPLILLDYSRIWTSQWCGVALQFQFLLQYTSSQGDH